MTQQATNRANSKSSAQQWRSAILLYLAGVLTLATFAYGCKLLLTFL